MTVLQVCAFAAPNAGNFIASLTQLEDTLSSKGIQTIYAFSDGAQKMAWCQQIQKRAKVYFIPTAKARILPKTYSIFRRIYKENEIDIIHSHFELYDIPATVTAPKHTKVFWHLHDPIQVRGSNRELLWRIQYGIVGKRARLLSVSDHYRRLVVELGFPENQTQTILNCIDLSRIHQTDSHTEKTYDFLTFGWDFYRKGDDLIINACDRLEQEGYNFKLLLNGNQNTWDDLDKYLGGKYPSYLILGMPTDNVNLLYDKSKVFVQASRRETFSYAVCEATYAGMPVICSNISGLEWAQKIPSIRFFKNEDSNSLYYEMKKILDGETICADILDQSIKTIKDNYSLESWTKKIIQIYQL